MPHKLSAYQETSTGHNLGTEHHLDKHYYALQAEYEATLRAVGLQPRWHVLDAGSGNGVFLPLMSQLVRSTGRISCIDLAPENVDRVQSRANDGHFACPVNARVADVTDLPYQDGEFDAAWSANVTQYLTDEQLFRAMEELRRVTKPGGLVAIKEVDVSVWQFQPQHPLLIWRLLQALQSDVQMAGAMRGTRLPQWFRKVGLVDVSSATTFAERRHPMHQIEKDYIRSNLEFLSKQAATRDLLEDDKKEWRLIGEDPDALIGHPDFCYRELYCLTIGLVPGP